ncbi:hypothetical protein ACKKBF_B15340 [Auxenochlorella protothecoides x Auxenochlorella symbiontica]
MDFRQTGFSGSAARHGAVSLGGRSRREETRAEILERTRREREERRINRLRANAATTIQAGWRCRRDLIRAKETLRRRWQGCLEAELSASCDSSLMATDAAFLRAFMFFADAKVAGDIPLLPRAAEATSRSPAPLRTLQRRRLVALTCAGLCAPAGPDSSTCLWPLLARLLDSPDRLARVCTALLPGCLEWAACTALHAGTDAPGTESLDAGVHGVLSLVCALDPAEVRGALRRPSPSTQTDGAGLPPFPPTSFFGLLSTPQPWLGFPRTRSLLPALAAFAAPGLGAGLEGAGADAAMEGVDAALSLLGNLTEGAAGRAGAPLGAADAGALAHVICRLVARVAAAGGQLPGRGGTGTLPGSRLAPEVERQLAGLASHAFLQALVGPLLSLEAQCGGMPGALALCRLLDALAGAVPGMRERLMLKLSVGTPFLAQLWSGYLQPGMQAHGLTGQPWRARGLGPRHPGEDPGWMLPLSILSSTCSILISTGEDGDLYDRTFPLPLPDLVQALKRAVWWVLGGGEAARAQAQGGPGPGLQAQVVETAGRLLGQLCDRNGRRAFVAAEAFHVPASFPVDVLGDLMAADPEAEGGDAARRPQLGDGRGRAAALWVWAPCLIPFHQRVQAFQQAVAQDRASYYEAEESWQLRTGSYSRDFVPVRRGQVLNDAFQALGGAGGTLKGRVRIQFISDLGFPEAGVDGGGLFKEFLEEVSKEGFDPGRGLFAVTSDQRLYPAPGAAALVPDAPRLLAFLGQLLGKALLEGTLVDLPLATFFLQKMAGRGCELRDLASLDPELAANLGKLRAYDAATLAGLELTFTVTDVLAGEAREVELVQGGARRSVTRDNVIEYVHRMADFKLNRQLAGPVGAFLGGLHSIIPPHWLAPFSAAELQALISGGEQGLDLADLAAHARYGGGYAADHPSILLLWRALAALTAADQALFLRFVTSCPRPPLLGFKYLQPPLSIQMAGAATGEALGRLPTASTCMNLLKLPPYTSLEVMLDKLRYAITAGAGFDLS